MGRRIVTEEDIQTAKALEGTETVDLQADGYWDKVIKNVPADVVAGWTAILGLFKVQPGSLPDIETTTILWILSGVFLVATFFWTYRQTSVPGQKPAWVQILVSTVAFAVWAFALGTPFDSLPFYDPRVAAAILIVWTIIVGAINPNQ